jgi:MFS transporter, SP family, general alpha glucoside:H+ symporter
MENSASPTNDLEDRKYDAAIIAIGSAEEIGAEAKAAIKHEYKLTFLEAMKLYLKAAGWSIFFSLGIIITAFDSQLLENLYATPAFQRDFSYLY